MKSLTAESEGFEPPVLLQTTVFKTAAFDRSANSPPQKYKLSYILQIPICFFLVTAAVRGKNDFSAVHNSRKIVIILPDIAWIPD